MIWGRNMKHETHFDSVELLIKIVYYLLICRLEVDNSQQCNLSLLYSYIETGTVGSVSSSLIQTKQIIVLFFFGGGGSIFISANDIGKSKSKFRSIELTHRLHMLKQIM